jgi:hypothetical protein
MVGLQLLFVSRLYVRCAFPQTYDTLETQNHQPQLTLNGHRAVSCLFLLTIEKLVFRVELTWRKSPIVLSTLRFLHTPICACRSCRKPHHELTTAPR